MNKKILITGSTRGIGFSIAEYFSKNSWDVCITGKTKENIDRAKHTLESRNENNLFELIDYTNISELKSLKEVIQQRWGSLNCLVINLGSGKGTKTLKSTFKENYDLFNLNFTTAYHSIEFFKDLLLSSNPASIIFIGSIASDCNVGAPINYAMSKKSLSTLNSYFSLQLSHLGIRVNFINPGHVNVKDGIWDRKNRENPIEFETFVQSKTLINRVIEPKEIASFIYSIVESEYCGAINGSSFTLDGGTSLIK